MDNICDGDTFYLWHIYEKPLIYIAQSDKYEI